jgi:hypothetical protein
MKLIYACVLGVVRDVTVSAGMKKMKTMTKMGYN